MKNIKFIFIILSILSLTPIVLNSCDNKDDEHLHTINTNTIDKNVEILKNSIDSVNRIYLSSNKITKDGEVAKKWAKRGICSLVDAVAAGLSAETGPLSFVISSAASALYEDYLDYCIDYGTKDSTSACIVKSVTEITVPNTYIPQNDNPSYIDSIGYIHNCILAELKANKRQYIISENEIDYLSLLNDCYYYSTKYTTDIKWTVTSMQYKLSIANVLQNLTSAFWNYAYDNISIEQCFNELGEIYNATFGTSFNKVEFIKDMILEIQPVLNSLEYEYISGYADILNEIIENSNIQKEQKDDLRILYNTAINSQLYWKDWNDKQTICN